MSEPRQILQIRGTESQLKMPTLSIIGLQDNQIGFATDTIRALWRQGATYYADFRIDTTVSLSEDHIPFIKTTGGGEVTVDDNFKWSDASTTLFLGSGASVDHGAGAFVLSYNSGSFRYEIDVTDKNFEIKMDSGRDFTVDYLGIDVITVDSSQINVYQDKIFSHGDIDVDGLRGIYSSPDYTLQVIGLNLTIKTTTLNKTLDIAATYGGGLKNIISCDPSVHLITIGDDSVSNNDISLESGWYGKIEQIFGGTIYTRFDTTRGATLGSLPLWHGNVDGSAGGKQDVLTSSGTLYKTDVSVADWDINMVDGDLTIYGDFGSGLSAMTTFSPTTGVLDFGSTDANALITRVLCGLGATFQTKGGSTIGMQIDYSGLEMTFNGSFAIVHTDGSPFGAGTKVYDRQIAGSNYNITTLNMNVNFYIDSTKYFKVRNGSNIYLYLNDTISGDPNSSSIGLKGGGDNSLFLYAGSSKNVVVNVNNLDVIFINEDGIRPQGDAVVGNHADNTAPTGTRLDGDIWLDLDASANGTLMCYSGGSWRTVAALT